jgi:hypothetical protein
MFVKLSFPVFYTFYVFSFQFFEDVDNIIAVSGRKNMEEFLLYNKSK